MGATPEAKIQRWMNAAGQTGKSQAVRDRVVISGEFLEKTARMDERSACSCLTGIDFSKPVKVVRLPDKLYVQYVKQHKGVWFTDTGLTPDLVGLAKGARTRELFRPAGMVHALKSTAGAIRDSWTIKPDPSLSTAEKRKLAELTRGGGTQYIVFDKHRMTRTTGR